MSDNEKGAAPVTEMTADEAKEWAWNTLKADLEPRNWTVSESGAFFGFFCWGWNYRAQYERQRPALTDEQVREIAETLAGLRTNYDVAEWDRITQGFTRNEFFPVAGAVCAIRSLCDLVEKLAIREAMGRGERG
jgi:hypothetical protein